MKLLLALKLHAPTDFNVIRDGNPPVFRRTIVLGRVVPIKTVSALLKNKLPPFKGSEMIVAYRFEETIENHRQEKLIVKGRAHMLNATAKYMKALQRHGWKLDREVAKLYDFPRETAFEKTTVIFTEARSAEF